MGPICPTFVHSQIHLHYMCKIDSQSVQPFDHNFPAFWIVDPIKAPTMPPWGIVGLIVWASVHSQMNPQTCTTFGANRSSRLTASPAVWMCDILTPPPLPTCPLGYWGVTCIEPMPIPRWIRRREPNVVPIGPAVWQLPKLLNVWPPNPRHAPWGIEGWLVFSLCPFPDESADVNQSWCQSVQPFDSFPWLLLNVWPPNPPPPSAPLCLSGQFVWRISIPRWICTCVPNLKPIGPAVWHLPLTFELVTP